MDREARVEALAEALAKALYVEMASAVNRVNTDERTNASDADTQDVASRHAALA
jgi:hypothetical protein